MMPILIALALAAVLVLAMLKRSRRSCNWRPDNVTDRRPPFARWRCAACGVEAYSSDGHPPKDCKKMLKSGL